MSFVTKGLLKDDGDIARIEVTSIRGTSTRLPIVNKWKKLPSSKDNLASRSWCHAAGLRTATS